MDFTKPRRQELRHFACKECGNIRKIFGTEKPPDWNDPKLWKHAKFCPKCRMITLHTEISVPEK